MKKHARWLMRYMGLLVLYFTAAQAQWVQTNGPWGSGYITTLAASGDVVLAGSVDNGVFRSIDGAASWSPVNSGLPLVAGAGGLSWINDCAIHNGVLFAATNDGLFRSTNDGASWAALHAGGASDSGIMLVRVLKACGAGLFAGSRYGGMLRSTDNGDSWSVADSGLNNSLVQSICAIGSSLYAGIYGQGVFRSTNSGLTWNAVNSGLTDLNVMCLAGSDSAVFAGMAGSGVFRLADNGLTWTAVTTGLANKNIVALGVSGSALFAGTEKGCFRSIDNGENWTAVERGLPRGKVTAFAVVGGAIVAGTEIGIFRSTENGASWNATINHGIQSDIIVSGLLGIEGKLLALAGVQYSNTGNVFMSEDNGVHWMYAVSTLLRDTGAMRPSWVLPRTRPVFAWNGEQSLLLTSDTAFSISVDSGLIINPYADSWALALFSFTADANILFAGTAQGVVRSTDAGAHWIAPDSAFQKYPIYSLLSKNGIIVAGSDGGVFVSSNSGMTWIMAAFGLKNMRILALVSCKGAIFAASSYDGIFRSIDNGATWNAVNSGLANTDVFALLSHDSALFAGTYGSGVFLSTNNGESWNAFNTGFPDMRVLSLAINNGALYAGTEGYGLWSRPLSQVAVISDHPKSQEASTQIHLDLRIPSPTNPCLKIAFSLPHPDHVTIGLYSLSGKLVAPIVNKLLGGGSYSYQWDGRTMARGCYLVRMQEGNRSFARSVYLAH